MRLRALQRRRHEVSADAAPGPGARDFSDLSSCDQFATSHQFIMLARTAGRWAARAAAGAAGSVARAGTHTRASVATMPRAVFGEVCVGAPGMCGVQVLSWRERGSRSLTRASPARSLALHAAARWHSAGAGKGKGKKGKKDKKDKGAAAATAADKLYQTLMREVQLVNETPTPPLQPPTVGQGRRRAMHTRSLRRVPRRVRSHARGACTHARARSLARPPPHAGLGAR